MESQVFSLQKYSGPSSRHTCPGCGKPRRFTRYVNVETGEYLADHVGRCDREIECGYHYKPKQYFLDNVLVKVSTNDLPSLRETFGKSLPRISSIQHITSFIPFEFVQKSTIDCVSNHFLEFIDKRFGNVALTNVKKRFHIGSSKHWPGATVFWQVDKDGHVRTGHVMLYNPTNCKRVKEPFPHVTWAHSLLKEKLHNFNLEQCLFGEHQINLMRGKEIVIVESEKTAVIASIYFPEYTWMASGGLSMLSVNRLKSVKAYSLILYPDLKALEKWEAKAAELISNGFKVTVSTLLENVATANDKTQGLDLADYLLQMDTPKSDLQKLIDKNPIVRELVKRFDLSEFR